MRVAIRLVAAVAVVLVLVAIAVAQHGEQARYQYPQYPLGGIVEVYALFILVALMVALFLIASLLGLMVAIRAKERRWAIAIALGATGVSLIYFGLFSADGFLVPLVQPFLPPSSTCCRWH